jgi:hypothetical protein
MSCGLAWRLGLIKALYDSMFMNSGLNQRAEAGTSVTLNYTLSPQAIPRAPLLHNSNSTSISIWERMDICSPLSHTNLSKNLSSMIHHIEAKVIDLDNRFTPRWLTYISNVSVHVLQIVMYLLRIKLLLCHPMVYPFAKGVGIGPKKLRFSSRALRVL